MKKRGRVKEKRKGEEKRRGEGEGEEEGEGDNGVSINFVLLTTLGFQPRRR